MEEGQANNTVTEDQKLTQIESELEKHTALVELLPSSSSKTPTRLILVSFPRSMTRQRSP